MDRPARLSANLLARKGEAFPAGAARPALRSVAPVADDLSPIRPPGWERSCGGEPQATPRQPPSASQERVRLTIRLDPARHTRLRIAAARRNRSSQDLVVEALDALLDACGVACPCLQGEGPELGKGQES